MIRVAPYCGFNFAKSSTTIKTKYNNSQKLSGAAKKSFFNRQRKKNGGSLNKLCIGVDLSARKKNSEAEQICTFE